jgi:hypothetical protein
MIAYEVTVNGKRVATAGISQGVVSAIANWVFIPSDAAGDAKADWHAHFSVGALDDVTADHLNWFGRDLQVGDEIRLRLIETEQVDTPAERKPREAAAGDGDAKA